MAFRFGTHRCMGNCMAEMQLRVPWEEILERFDRIEPVRVTSNLIQGIVELPVRIPA